MIEVEHEIGDDREGLKPAKAVTGRSQEPAEKGRDEQAPRILYIDYSILTVF